MTSLGRSILGAIAIVGLASCGVESAPETAGAHDVTSRALAMPASLPPMKAFAAPGAAPPARPNSEIATDFLDLAFELESGRALPVLTRFEGPVTLSVSGAVPAVLEDDLDRLLARLRDEAGIDIARVDSGPAGITLQVISKRELQSVVHGAACFVAPNVSSWSEYKAGRHSEGTDWAQMLRRERMAVFLPGDVSPQEMRDCLHEEIAQALGPVNDLYRLADSVFNDDNFHTVLTGFDMLILRAYYAPELHSGMSRAEVAAQLPDLLFRLSPAGGKGRMRAASPTPAAWKEAIETAMSTGGTSSARRDAARRAVELARAYNWRDTRLGFSLFAQGRLNLGVNSDIALMSFREAEAIYERLPGTELQAAHMAVQLAAHALSLGNAETAVAIVDRHVPAVIRAENAALLSTLMMIKAEALDHLGRSAEAAALRLDSLGWARYGFGSEAEVGARLEEIAAIAPGGRS